MLQAIDQVFHLILSHTGQGFSKHRAPSFGNAFQMLLDFRRTIDAPRASVMRIIAPRDPALVLELVEKLAERRLLELGHIGKFRLR